jgi:MerR family copper efflux transcriptional regulator
MADKLTIGEVARQSEVPARTIRFYEAEGILAAPERTEAGYRLYSPADVRRLRLIRRARLLGMGLQDVKALVVQAFSSDCTDYLEQLVVSIARQRAEIDRRIAELRALRAELDKLEQHVHHDRQGCCAEPGQKVAECSFCPLIDERGGESNGR